MATQINDLLVGVNTTLMFLLTSVCACAHARARVCTVCVYMNLFNVRACVRPCMRARSCVHGVPAVAALKYHRYRRGNNLINS